MRYLLALIFPPLAVLLCGRPFLSILNCLFTLCFYFPGALHAMLVVSNRMADKRSDREIREMRAQTRELGHAIRNQRPAVVVLTPAPAPAPTLPGPSAPPPAPAQPALPEPEPRAPRMTPAELWAKGVETRDEAIEAYRNLPEWAQPITWGLAAGTVLSIGLAAALLIRR